MGSMAVLSGGAHHPAQQSCSCSPAGEKKKMSGGDVVGLRRRHVGYRCHDDFAPAPRHGSHRGVADIRPSWGVVREEKETDDV